MKLRGIDFGQVLGASGVQGFFGEGYSHHQWLEFVPGFSFRDMTFVAKTTTLAPRKGNMPLRADGITPRDFKPQCIVVKPWSGVALNAVGLSGPGAEALFKDCRWQARTRPFMISFMAVAPTRAARREELAAFVALFRQYLSRMNAPIGLQINFSCPNVGLGHDDLIEEVTDALSIAGVLRIPLMPKVSVLLPIDAACIIAMHPACDGFCVSNTIPWGALPDRVNWRKLFGSETSPLAHLGGGGLSGKPLLPLVAEWVRAARAAGITKPINAGGGIMAPRDVDVLVKAGASSVFLGTIAILRPHRLRATIRRAYDLLRA